MWSCPMVAVTTSCTLLPSSRARFTWVRVRVMSTSASRTSSALIAAPGRNLHSPSRAAASRMKGILSSMTSRSISIACFVAKSGERGAKAGSRKRTARENRAAGGRLFSRAGSGGGYSPRLRRRSRLRWCMFTTLFEPFCLMSFAGFCLSSGSAVTSQSSLRSQLAFTSISFGE